MSAMRIRAFKYLTAYLGAACGVLSLLGEGLWVLALPVYAFALIPALELFLRPDTQNMDAVELEIAREDRIYDWILYLMVPIQWGLIGLFLWTLKTVSWSPWEVCGKIWAAGICCGVLGINVAHELGHRNTIHEQWMAKLLLLSSLYMHFFIEHNRGHHKHVSTPEDPASARRGENVFAFWIRSVSGSYLSAWNLENDRLRRAGKPTFSLQNEMLRFQLIQAGLILFVGVTMGWAFAAAFVAAGMIGILLLETVNYIEHYGLERKSIGEGVYERVRPEHSWNSDHPLGRLVLFELSRHSDHHYRAAKKYQTLLHHEDAPQMPTGYPGMMVLALIPPLWFAVMHRQLDAPRHSAAFRNA